MMSRRPKMSDEQVKTFMNIMGGPGMIEPTLLSCLVQDLFEWNRWMEEIPYLNFPKDWEVRMVPPFAGAIVRFFVRKSTTPKNERISIYLDCYDALGFMGQPYWEVYPVDGDTYRCPMQATEDLLKAIEDGLECLEKDPSTPQP